MRKPLPHKKKQAEGLGKASFPLVPSLLHLPHSALTVMSRADGTINYNKLHNK